jgi:hypothetical protein
MALRADRPGKVPSVNRLFIVCLQGRDSFGDLRRRRFELADGEADASERAERYVRTRSLDLRQALQKRGDPSEVAVGQLNECLRRSQN